jgi:GST-like protein
MIDLYTWSTPNGRKVSIMLEELGLPYEVHPVHIGKDEQFKPEFVAINPNSKIPAVVDSDGPGGERFPLFESGAILIYLAEKHGRFLPKDAVRRYVTIQWLMFQMGGVGPMFGQTHHFFRAAPEDVPYGKKRYHTETKRLYGVMNKRLGEAKYLAGDEYTIADIATYPWVARYEWHQVDLNEFPNVKRWFDEISARPAVKKGMAVPTPP